MGLSFTGGSGFEFGFNYSKGKLVELSPLDSKLGPLLMLDERLII